MATSPIETQMTLTSWMLRSSQSIFRLASIVWLAAIGLVSGASSRHLIDVWTPYSGLPQSRVLSIAQSPDGYLWVATQLGWLARFDGIRFTHFNPDNTPALVSPEIMKLLVDDQGVLWVADIDGRLISYSGGTFTNRLTDKPGYDNRIIGWLGRNGDESRFVTASGSLLRLRQNPVYENLGNPPQPVVQSVRQFCQDSDGVLWCRNTAGQFGRWMDGKLQVENVSGIQVHHMLAASGGGLWLAARDGLWRYQSGKPTQVPLALAAEDLEILQLARNPDGSLWLRTSKHILLVRGNEIIHKTPLAGMDELPLVKPIEMHADSNGGVWIVRFGRGVWNVDSTGSLTMLSSRNGLPSDQVETWFEDSEKNIWLGTAAGLVRLRQRWFQTVEPDPSALGSGIISISQDPGGAMWFGRADGLSCWQDDVVRNIPLTPLRANFPITDVTIAPGAFPGEVWLGTVQTGAMLLRDGKIEQPFPYNAPGLAIRTIRRDPHGNIWLGGEFGLFRWDGHTLHKFGLKEGLKPGHIHDISFDATGTPWIAIADDLLVVYRDGRFTRVDLPGVSRSLRIYTLLCGAEDEVWIGTVGGGLLHHSRGRLRRYTTADGLPSNSISQLLADDNGFLWGGTYRGIFRVSTTALDMRSKGVKQPFIFHNYGQSDGLPAVECSGGLQPACWKANDGQLWFSTSSGAVRIDPRFVRKNLSPPRVIIETMMVNGVPVKLGRDANPSPAHSIHPGRHRYEFHFTGINFTAPEKIGFQWRLSGQDGDWVDGRQQREASYSGLPPGNYLFEVRARNNDGIWSPDTSTVSFRVEPFFWQRPTVKAGFWTAGLSLPFLFFTAIMRRRHRRELRHMEYERSLEQQRFRHKQAMQAERARIAAELHDDLGANLTQIQWLGEAVSPTDGSDPESRDQLGRISGKCREMVCRIDEIVWAVNPQNDTLEQLVTYICEFAEQFFRDSPTRARIDVTPDIPHHQLEADARHHIFLIAKEALHNVAKHAGTDRVWIRITIEEGILKILIEDHGQGFDAANAPQGHGLANMRRRAELAGASLAIDSSAESGTLVTIQLKLDPTHH